jgi:excisionase family DNA binding protein
MPDRRDDLALPIPAGLVDAIASAIADRLAARHAPPAEVSVSPWLDFEAARVYLGFSRDALYKLTAARAIPFRKRVGGQGLRFHRGELDAWMDEAYPRVDSLGE